MTDSPYQVHAKPHTRHDGEQTPAGGLLTGGWKAIEPLYIWSALTGLAVAFLLIGLGMLVQNNALH